MKLEFKKLEAENVKEINPFFGLRSNITCDSTVFDSYLWRDYYQVQYAVVPGEDILLMEMQEDGEHCGALPLCRPERMKEGFLILEDFFENEMGIPLNIYDADEEGLALVDPDPEKYEIVEEPDHADYIYDAESLRTLAGKKYHKKKNNVNAFLRAYEGRWEYVTLDRNAGPEIRDFLIRWQQEKDEEEEASLQAELSGLQGYLEHMDCFDASMAGIRIDGVMEAFTLGTYNPVDRMSVVHVEKANPEIRGLYTLINQEFQKHEFPEALLVNREDDVGLPSLRRAKESYHPIRMGRKFDIIPRRQEAE